jgi:leucyl aminopeptidase
LDKGLIIGQSVGFARDLSNHPANVLTPTYLAKEAKKVADNSPKMEYTVFDVKEFKKMGMGAFLGVAQGAKEPAKMILVEYKGGKKSQKPIALVGKGLTFDSGGISIKPAGKMDEMKFDMCGSATVMGVLKAVAELKPKLNIVFAIGSTENMPDGNAQRPGDIVTAYNGKTIEVLNTDAEGRLVLADVLSYVNAHYEPEAILDFATLTGAVLIALGNIASGVMGNDDTLMKEVKKASQTSGEKVWELPLWKEYCRAIKGKYADIQNLGEPRLAGTIAAGAFLKEFVNDTPWVHLDIAGTAWGPKEPTYHPKVGATGVGVRMVYQFLENRK